jgi:MFS family permease
MTAGFFFTFMAYLVAERYVSVHFSESGHIFVGLASLAVLYLALFLGNLLSPILINRWGTRKSFVLANVLYLVWVLTLGLTDNTWAIMVASVLAGLAMALSWNGMAGFMIRNIPEEQHGQQIGKVLSGFGVGGLIGLVGTSFLLTHFSLQQVFLGLSLPVLAGMICFMKVGAEARLDDPQNIGETFANGTVQRMATLCVTTFAVFGLLVTVIPFEIAKILGEEHIGWLSAIALLTVSLCALFGKQVDAFGRNRMIIACYIGLLIGLPLLYVSNSPTMTVVGVGLVCVSYAPLFLIMYTLANRAPAHKIDTAYAVFGMMDDVTLFFMLVLTIVLEAAGLPLEYLYLVALGVTLMSAIFITPLLKGGRDLEEAQTRLAAAFPVPAE